MKLVETINFMSHRR